MNNAINLSPEFAIAGQVSSEQLQTAKQQGYQSVVNLRAPGEEGFLHDEQTQAESAGLNYVNIPVSPNTLNETADQVLTQLDELDKPILVHCGSALRAGVMVLAYLATRQGKSTETVLEQARQAGFTAIDNKPPMKQFLETYIADHS